MSGTHALLSDAANLRRTPPETVHARYRGIQFTLVETAAGRCRWSFVSPEGRHRDGRVNGDMRWATTVVRRGIDVWHLMNPDRSKAACAVNGWADEGDVPLWR